MTDPRDKMFPNSACSHSYGSTNPMKSIPKEDWQHLKQYGYAPGHYMNKCLTCEKTVTDVDKRAIICRPCAEARHDQSR